MDIRFDGKRALVTGAGKGIGRGIAIKLAECGAQVVAISRTQEDLDSLKRQASRDTSTGGSSLEGVPTRLIITWSSNEKEAVHKSIPSIETHSLDVTDWNATRELVQKLGNIDLLVNNAGTATCAQFLDVPREDVDEQFALNFNAVFNISQVVAKGMVAREKGGSIVMMSSISAFKAVDQTSVYCCTKAAVDQLTRCLALELGPHKIRVNAVNPTVVLTKLAIERGGWGDPKKANPIIDRTPLRRLGEVDDIVGATLFLLSDKADMVNGVILPVDGGISDVL